MGYANTERWSHGVKEKGEREREREREEGGEGILSERGKVMEEDRREGESRGIQTESW